MRETSPNVIHSSIPLVILAGGENIRLGVLAGTIYKGFLPIHQQSMVHRNLLRAYLCGIRHVFVLCDVHDELIVRSCNEHGFGKALRVKGVIFPGLPGKKIIHVSESEGLKPPICVVLSDSYARIDFQDFFRFHHRIGVDSTIITSIYTIPYGVCFFDGPYIVRFSEKPQTKYHINCGYMLLGKKALDHLRVQPSLDQVLATLANDKELAGFQILSSAVMVDTIFDLGKAHTLLSQRPEGDDA